MPLFFLSIVVQVIAVVHVLRTGRDMRWLFLIVLLPAVGVLAYLIIEVLPALRQNPAARHALQQARATVDPNRGVREGALDYERSKNVETASRLAEELTRAGNFADAIHVCNEARKGLFEDDPKILLALANAQFAAEAYGEVIATLEYLREKNPGFRAPDGHLIYARALEQTGATARALEEYEAVSQYYPGAEARVRLAVIYKKLGRTEQAGELFAAVLKDARLSPKHVRRAQREWIELAEREQV